LAAQIGCGRNHLAIADSSLEVLRSIAEIQFEVDRFVERKEWDVMRECADNLEAYLSLMSDKELPFAEPFTRKFTGTLVWLVAAAALVKKATGKPHYPEIATLVGIICPKQKPELRTEGAIEKSVTRFKKRNQEFVRDFLSRGKVKKSVRKWLRSLQRSQSR
jgi:hypothetical protein